MATPMHMPAGFDAGFVSAVLDDALEAGAHVFGISGLQGCGKSTLAAQLAAEAARRGLRCALLSIDDVYLGRAQRLRLARGVHPLLATRGPPGTHDAALAIEVLDALHEGRSVRLPRFDKRSDERLPPSDWPIAGQADLVLFEGWFLGTPAEDRAALQSPLNALERDQDRDGAWRRWCNHALGRDYPALWARLDRLLLLQVPSFEQAHAWRWRAEQDMAADGPGPATMDRIAFDRFMQHYERVSRQALRSLPAIADRVAVLDAGRRAASIRASPDRMPPP